MTVTFERHHYHPFFATLGSWPSSGAQGEAGHAPAGVSLTEESAQQEPRASGYVGWAGAGLERNVRTGPSGWELCPVSTGQLAEG